MLYKIKSRGYLLLIVSLISQVTFSCKTSINVQSHNEHGIQSSANLTQPENRIQNLKPLKSTSSTQGVEKKLEDRFEVDKKQGEGQKPKNRQSTTLGEDEQENSDHSSNPLAYASEEFAIDQHLQENLTSINSRLFRGYHTELRNHVFPVL